MQLIAISGAGSALRESRFASWKSWAEPVMPPPARASHAICERLREALTIATDINIIAILFAYRCKSKRSRFMTFCGVYISHSLSAPLRRLDMQLAPAVNRQPAHKLLTAWP